MNKYSKLMGALFLISLLALLLTGCDNPPWESGYSLVLKVDTPKDGTTVNATSVTVSGRVTGTQSKGAKVTVNEIDVPVNDGKYSTNVTLTEGKNVINIIATSGEAKPKKEVTVTCVPAKK